MDKETRFIVDRDINDTAMDGIFMTISDAIDATRNICDTDKNQPKPINRNFKLKVASNLYEEMLYINVPGLILEPKEKGGELTL